MQESILDIVEQSLLNIATRYKEFSSSPTVLEADLKGFDEQLNDIMDRYNKLKGLQSTYTAEELTIKLNEFKNLYDDMVLKINNGFFKGGDGKSFTFDMFTPEQLVSFKGLDGKSAYEIAVQNGYEGTALEWLKSLIGEDGKSFTFDMFTPEQLASFKGLDGKSAYEIAVQNGYEGSALEWLKSLIGEDGKSFTFDMFTPEQLASFKGLDGKSAYEIAVQNGYEGSALEWLKSLIGKDGKSFTFDMFTPEQLELLKGKDGLPLTYDSLTLAQKEDLASHVTVSGGSSETSPTTIEDIEGLNDVIGDLYAKHGEQEQKFGGINLSQFYQQTQGRLGELDGKVIPLFNALFGVYEEDEATGQQILVQEGLIDRFNALNTQINPN